MLDALVSSALRGLGSEEIEVRAADGGSPRRTRGILTSSTERTDDGEIVVNVEELVLTTSLEDGADLDNGSIVIARGSRFKVTGSYAFRHGYRFNLAVDE